MIPSAPVGPAGWVCLLLAVVWCVPVVNRRLQALVFDSSKTKYVVAIATLSFTSSLLYVHTYLRGGPRIIDATSYLLQAKTFASGHFAFAPPGALHSYTGRFLVVTPEGHLAVLFPPGFAALLALGVALRVPLLVNPVVGAGLALLTYRLGAQWFSERSGRIAGLLSTLCACLRYHSADTMSHAWSAVLVLGALLCATHEHCRRWMPLGAGACAGFLFATRPVTGLVFGLAALVLTCRPLDARTRRVVTYVVGALPGLTLWWAYQWLTTGSLWQTTQTEYYARSDFPFGCFRLGFGATIGCRFEHGDFIEKYQSNGFGIVEALQVTARRLMHHHRDVTNLPGLALVGLLAVSSKTFARRRAVCLLLLVACHMTSYALFYFDGNYPGGGARLFVDVLPLEQVLLGVALQQSSFARYLPSACCLGFALWGSAEHAALATREGGRPMFEKQVWDRNETQNGLVFVTTDHGFNLGFDPGVMSNAGSSGLHVARMRNDGFDAATWTSLGKPPAFIYRFDPSLPDPAHPSIEAYQPPNLQSFSGTSLWASPVTGGSTIPVHNPAGLRLIPRTQHTLELHVELPVSHDDQYELELQLANPRPSTLQVLGWDLVGERRSNNTEILRFGPRFLHAGATSLRLRTKSEATLTRVSLTHSQQPGAVLNQAP